MIPAGFFACTLFIISGLSGIASFIIIYNEFCVSEYVLGSLVALFIVLPWAILSSHVLSVCVSHRGLRQQCL